MISQDKRVELNFKITNPGHVLQTFKERGKTLFGTDLVHNMLEESIKHIKDCSRCVIAKDERENTKSNYLAMFLTDFGKFVVIPCFIDDTHITILTLKDGMKDDNPNWHITTYNEIGQTRGIKKLDYIFRQNNM